MQSIATREKITELNKDSALEIVAITDEQRPWLRSKVQEIWQGRYVYTRGIAHEPADLPGFMAVRDGVTVGVATFHIKDAECELVTIDAFEKWSGVGSSLIEAVEEEARKQQCGRMWMVTTNDDVDGMRFYQRRGYFICDVHPGAVEENRKQDPSIPLIGNHGIDIRDEIELEKNLYCWIGW